MNRQLSSVSSRNSSSKGYGLNGSEDEYDDVDLGNAGWLSASNNGDVQQWTLRIKSFRDLELQLPSNSMVSDLKERTKNALGERAQDRYMRLICKGRLLSPDDSAIQEFNVKDGDVIHAVLAQPQAPAQLKEQERRAKRDHGNTNTATIATIPTIPTIAGSNGSTAGSTLQRRQRRRGRGTVVGPGGRVTRVQPGENDDADDSWGSGSSDEEDTEMARERLGFDRLRGSGMSRSEITAIRTYFSRQVDRHIEELPNSHDEEPDLRRRRLLMEDDWMALQGPASEFRLNLNQSTLLRFTNGLNGAGGINRGLRVPARTMGTQRDFYWGFMLGFFVGFGMLIWVWVPSIPHKQKLGIMTGITMALALEILQDEHIDEFDFE